ncbi:MULTISPECIES: glycosyltransferase family 2 protein [unclassified Paenibacillus]|uniref:glycosyltransferase family 2 protein n=1 Tax=unclassified Paenibacillus TaxID=185978 RepID=UPI00095485B3|nr:MULTISPECIES: glycosyltransferase family 2 protein [unclassified Paenibacillus]ASS66732.1 glycosyltransferase family 2 protein [Paenibacillus sp. RUD330]SIP97279.1 Glycosyltransferase, GT2 family [Paenibacillus sp. RU4X]SIQ15847.1 Glycosyltransferase, GT2 family [Paenibacillus sp. RU4T]
MKVTVAICTHNRAEDTKEAVWSVLRQQFDFSQYEVLVVDNKSTDGTWETMLELQRTAGVGPERVRCVREETLGLSAARNRAIREARGRYILFLDDDAVAKPGWMGAIVDVFERDAGIGCVGGKIDPVWEGGEPEWLPDMFKTLYTVLDYAPGVTEMEAPRIPFGANVAFRADVFKRHAPFREDLGRVGSNLLSSEESELIDRIRATHKVCYTPHAVVDHKIAKSRISRKWFLRRVYWQGISDAARKQRGPGYLLKQAVKVPVSALLLPFALADRRKAIVQLRRIQYSNGYIAGCLGLYK